MGMLDDRMKREVEEFRRLERICLDEAQLATMELERIGLLKVAEDCRRAAEEIDARAPKGGAANFLEGLWRRGR
ncbi:hypothetical protein Q2941_49080 [Bradyrhizobium sp. UFLA05-153]